jgi:poly(A) polymerase
MTAPPKARILPRAEHVLSRKDIDPDALKVLYRLHRNGHKAYLVGGGVRDLLLQKAPKDYDIGTDATPEEILDLFRNSRVIGRRFPIVHVMFGPGKVMEVATFRAFEEEEPVQGSVPTDQDSLEEEARLEEEADQLEEENNGKAPAEKAEPVSAQVRPRPRPRRRGQGNDRGRHLLEFAEQNYGSPAEDARRRDLTINGLFYDIGDFSVIDHVGGLEDLAARRIRTIGDPDSRFASDPVRMIRALRHAGRTGFRIEEETWAAIGRHRKSLEHCSKARVLEEFYRDLRGGASLPTLRLMSESGVLQVLLPEADRFLPPGNDEVDALPWKRLEILDRIIAEGEAPSNAFLLALLFSAPMLEDLRHAEETRGGRVDSGRVAYRFLKPLTTELGVARRDNERLFLTAISQRRLARSLEGQPVPSFLRDKPYFPEAYRLFTLDAEARGLEVPALEFGGRGQGQGQGRGRRRRRRRRRPAK